MITYVCSKCRNKVDRSNSTTLDVGDNNYQVALGCVNCYTGMEHYVLCNHCTNDLHEMVSSWISQAEVD